MLGRIIAAFTGGNSSQSSIKSESSAASFASTIASTIDGQTAPVELKGFGRFLSPGDRTYVGIYNDGALVKQAEENGLFITDAMVGEALEFKQRSSEALKNAKKYYPAIAKGSKNCTKVVGLHTKTKALVTKNHLRQHQHNNVLRASQMRTAAGYIGEQDRMLVAGQQVVEQAQQFRAKLTAKMQKSAI